MDVREKLVGLMQNVRSRSSAWETNGDVADYLIAHGVTVQEWISVKDRLPEKDEYVWCYSNKYGGHFFAGYRGYYTGEWIESGCLHIGEVTHWMPLPEPPKGE